MHAQERREVVLRNTLRRETEWLRRGAAARTTKQQARIARAGDAGATRSRSSGRRNPSAPPSWSSRPRSARPRRLIEARGRRQALRRADDLRGRRPAPSAPGRARRRCSGPNGCGKSTLLRVLLGEEAPATGTVTRADGLAGRVLRAEPRRARSRRAASPTPSAPTAITSRSAARASTSAATWIASCSTSEQCDDGGRQAVGRRAEPPAARPAHAARGAGAGARRADQRSRTCATLAVLEETLTEFDGAVLLVSHDRYFVDQVATTILAFDSTRAPARRDGVTPFASLGQWEAWRAETARPTNSAAAAERRAAGRRRRGAAGGARAKALGYKEQREYDAHRGDDRRRRGRAARRRRRQRAARARERPRPPGRAARRRRPAPGRGRSPLRALGRAGGQARLTLER